MAYTLVQAPPAGAAAPKKPKYTLVQAPPAASPNMGLDIAKSLGTGIEQGAIGLAGLPADVGRWAGNLAGSGVDWLTGASPETIAQNKAKADSIMGAGVLAPPTSAGLTSAVEGVQGPMYKPQTTAGEYANTLGQFVPGMVMGPGSLPQRVVGGAASAVGSEAAGQASKGEWYEPYARLGGALLGGVVPDVARRAVTPLPVSAERQRLLGVMDAEGVPLTAGQRTGNAKLGYLESELGGGQARNIMDQQGEQFTAAALRRVGSNENRASPPVMRDAIDRIGNEFDTLAQRNNLPPDPQIATDVANAVTEYTNLVPATAQPAAAQNFAQDLLGVAQNGMTGAEYQAFRSRLQRLARGSTDPQLGNLYRNMAGSLDDAMERNLAATNSPDLGAWQNVRNQYRNLIVLERAASAAGKNTAEGIVQPSQLRNATVNAHGRRNYVRGEGDYAELGRAGEATMKPLPNSGTAGRQQAQRLGAGASAAAGAALGGHFGGLPEALLGFFAGGAVPYAAGSALMSRPVQAWLGNQLLPGRGLTAAQRAIVPLLGVSPRINGPR